MLDVGSLAPSFALMNQDYNTIKLSRLLEDGDDLLVFFFVQAGAPGCVREATLFNELLDQLAARRVKVVGITTEPVGALANMVRANNLRFDLLSDPEHESIAEWGAWRGQGVARMSYLLNPKGEVTRVFPRVNVHEHAAEVLALFDDRAPAPASPEVDAPAAPEPSPAPPAEIAAAAPKPATPATPAPASPAPAASPAELPLLAAHGVGVARSALLLLLALIDAGVELPADVAALAAHVASKKRA